MHDGSLDTVYHALSKLTSHALILLTFGGVVWIRLGDKEIQELCHYIAAGICCDNLEMHICKQYWLPWVSFSSYIWRGLQYIHKSSNFWSYPRCDSIF